MTENIYENTVVGRFWLCMQTLYTMMKDRYGIELKNETFESVSYKLRGLDLADRIKAQAYMDQFAFSFELEIPNRKIYVFWLCGKVGVKTESINKIAKQFAPSIEDINVAEEENDDDLEEIEEVEAEKAGTTAPRVILIQVEGCTITPPARKFLAKLPVIIEIFDHSDLKYNVTKHRLQPGFYILSEQEGDQIKEIYCASNDELPRMRWEDPIRRYYGLSINQIVKCVRLAEGGKDIFYRIVVPPQIGKKK